MEIKRAREILKKVWIDEARGGLTAIATPEELAEIDKTQGHTTFDAVCILADAPLEFETREITKEKLSNWLKGVNHE